LVGIFIVSFVTVYAVVEFLWVETLVITIAPLPEAVTLVSVYLLLAFLLWLVCLKLGIVHQVSLGERPSWRQAWSYISLAVPLIGTSLFFLYVVFLPLSYAYPEFVEWWLLDEPPLIWWYLDTRAISASVINVVLLVVIVPVVEEVLFRGFLLNRWWRKYSLWRGVIFSSLAFAILHIDIIGGVIFGVLLALIYVKTKSLVGPIIVHMANNGLVVALLLAEGVVTGSIEPPTLAEFQAHWWFAPLGAAIGIPWLIWFTRRLFRAGRL